MSNYDQNQLDKLLRLRCDAEAKGLNPKPRLHIHALATHFGISTDEVIERLEAMRKPKDQPV